MPAASATFNIAGSFEADDISAWYRSPVELGWAKSIKFDHDFKGRDALQAEVAAPRRQIRTLVWNADDVTAVYASLFRKDAQPYHFMEMPRDQRGFVYADKVLGTGGRGVGVATSRGYSYYFREMISLAVIDIDHAEIGRDLSVVWGNPGEPQIEIRAKVAPAPYKQDNRRVDLTSLR
jgi:vanillate/3-O-methylgallate O-demethylase